MISSLLSIHTLTLNIQAEQAAYGQPQPPAYGQPSGPGAYADDRGYGQGGVPGSEGPGGPQEGERGIGATLIGAGSGGFLGHELGGGMLGTLGGMIAGVVGANMLEKRHHKYASTFPKNSHEPKKGTC